MSNPSMMPPNDITALAVSVLKSIKEVKSLAPEEQVKVREMLDSILSPKKNPPTRQEVRAIFVEQRRYQSYSNSPNPSGRTKGFQTD